MFFVRMIWFYHLRKFFISSSPVWTCGDFVHPPINPPLGSCECKPTWFVLDRNLMRPLIWYSWAVTVRLTLDNSPDPSQSTRSKKESAHLDSTDSMLWPSAFLGSRFSLSVIFVFCVFISSDTTRRWVGLRCQWVWRNPNFPIFVREDTPVLFTNFRSWTFGLFFLCLGRLACFLQACFLFWHNTRWVLKR